MENESQYVEITPALAHKLIVEQFPEYAHLSVVSVERQGHDNRTYRLGENLLIRMPTDEFYALKVPKKQALLPKLASHLTVNIPVPVRMGCPSRDYPYPFSIYKWLPGSSLNLMTLPDDGLETLANDLATFLTELQSIDGVDGPKPGLHNWWRGDHISVYEKDARKQIDLLADEIDSVQALYLWQHACDTRWSKPPVWIHGDFSVGNILIKDGKLSAVIDFGGTGKGDPACDLVVAWTYLQNKAREIFIKAMALDEDTWLRARAWALWKATYELCQIETKNNPEAFTHKRIIAEVLIS